MGKCGLCDREQMDEEPCVQDKQIEYRDGVTVDAVPVSEGDVGQRIGHCADCWAPVGSVHHPRCDRETCPRCDSQLLSCSCDDVKHTNPDTGTSTRGNGPNSKYYAPGGELVD